MSASVIAMVAGGAVFVVVGASLVLLPRKRRVTRTRTMDASPEGVFDLLSSSAGFQTFNPYKDTDPNLEITPLGPERGVGAGFAFEGKEGKGTQTIIALVPNRSVTMQIDLGSMGQPIQTFELTPAASGTQVSWTVEMDFKFNPLARVFGLFVDKVFGRVYERGLTNLAAVAE